MSKTSKFSFELSCLFPLGELLVYQVQNEPLCFYSSNLHIAMRITIKQQLILKACW